MHSNSENEYHCYICGKLCNGSYKCFNCLAIVYCSERHKLIDYRNEHKFACHRFLFQMNQKEVMRYYLLLK